jgi:hypothetical protein
MRALQILTLSARGAAVGEPGYRFSTSATPHGVDALRRFGLGLGFAPAVLRTVMVP